MKFLLTGGAGYIGSHTAVEMIKAGHEIIIVDNLSNSDEIVIDRIEEITGTRPAFYPYDVADKEKMRQVFGENEIAGIIHFAGLKAVGESVEKPVEYYRNNLDTTLTLLEVMKEFGVNRFVFSSSATVYGEVNQPPYLETMEKGNCSNPYGWTKSMIEQILMDAAHANPELSVVLLRYFNPIGAHESGLIGEDPQGIPNNLMPYVSQVAIGKLPMLTIYGGDWDTPDGTCRRDFIHVVDLARGHVAAVEKIGKSGVYVYNLGTGKGYSVLEAIHAFEKACGKKLPYSVKPRRSGDVAECYANADKAKRELGWEARYGLDEMCSSLWNWQKKNPDGYGK